jgi:prohibitin 2
VLTATAQQKEKVVIAEAEATARKAEAEGQAAAVMKAADAEAYANLKVAQAQAEALKVQNAALVQNKEVLELRRIEVQLKYAERWNGALPTNIYGSAPVPLLNIDPK